MTRNQGLLLVAIATALSGTVLVLAGAVPTWLRVVVGIPFALLLPGHALMLVVDRDRGLGGLEWFTLSVGASVCVVMVASMGLAASLGLTVDGMVGALAAVTTLALLAAWVRSEPSSDSEEGPEPAPRSRVQLAAFGALAVLACCLVVLVLSIPRPGTSSSPPVVQLWGLPDTSGGLRLGARNVDAQSRRFLLTIEQAGKVIAQRVIDLPAGTDALFDVKKSATWTSSAPVVGMLTDESGIVGSRSVSVWTTQ